MALNSNESIYNFHVDLLFIEKYKLSNTKMKKGVGIGFPASLFLNNARSVICRCTSIFFNSAREILHTAVQRFEKHFDKFKNNLSITKARNH
jgi:hypothetical protein